MQITREGYGVCHALFYDILLPVASLSFFAVSPTPQVKAWCWDIRRVMRKTSAYRDEIVFTDCDMRSYWDVKLSLNVDSRDINAGINIKRVGRGLFPTLKRRKGNLVVGDSTTNSTLKEVLAVLKNAPEAYTLSVLRQV